MSFSVAPEDARRGGLLILGAGADDGPRLARLYAEGGYETIVAEDEDDSMELVGALVAPVFGLAFAGAASTAWAMTGLAAVSVVADAGASELISRQPRSPTILHLDPATHAQLADAFGTAQPDLPVHRLDRSADGERLLVLRTLRLFSTHAGGRGEV